VNGLQTASAAAWLLAPHLKKGPFAGSGWGTGLVKNGRRPVAGLVRNEHEPVCEFPVE